MRMVAIILFSFNVACLAQQDLCGYKSASMLRLSSQVSREMSEDVLYIPIVFHVVYQSADQNISDARILSQLEVINNDFLKANADAVNTVDQFKGVAGNPNIQFYIPTNGITRTSTTHGPFANDDLHVSSQGGKDAVDTRKYLNVWVANLGNQLSGYAASPGSPAFRDGVAIHFEYFGTGSGTVVPFNLGRTLTHEIGHWLGLDHVWGVGGCESDDGITDTPLQESPVAGCELNHQSCGGLNMVQNFMNSSTDACMTLFTKEQASRMRAVLEQYRPEAFTRDYAVTNVKDESVVQAIFPNPLQSGNIITFRLREPVYTVRVLVSNLLGQIVIDRIAAHESDELALDVGNLPDGAYIARVVKSNIEQSTKIIINRNF
jgi:hypothetical protein